MRLVRGAPHSSRVSSRESTDVDPPASSTFDLSCCKIAKYQTERQPKVNAKPRMRGEHTCIDPGKRPSID